MSHRLAVCGLVAAMVFAAAPALAQVKTSLQINYYAVPGTTSKALVSHMQRNPVRGDHGSAFANIRPRYSLSVSTRQTAGLCRASAVDVRIHFVMTLPKASQASRMSRKTLAAWNGFANFARRHEEAHQSSYVACANAFVAAAKRERGAACHAVSSEIRRMFSQAKRDCEAKQAAFDRGQRGSLRRLTLVRMSGY